MNYTIAAPATAADVKDDLLRLMQSNFPWGHQAELWYRWGYEQTPYRPNVCWLVETEARERVGFTSLMPRRMKVGETVCDVGQAANLNVAAEHRNALAAVKLQRAVVSHVNQSEMALAFGITRNAVAVLCRAGFRDLGGFSRWIKFFRTEHKLSRWISWTLPRRAVAAVIDLGLRLRATETYQRLPAGWQVLFDPSFDERFDDLWQAASSNFAVATERTSEYLQWRFGRDPQLQYRTLAIQDSDGRLHGSVIYFVSRSGIVAAAGDDCGPAARRPGRLADDAGGALPASASRGCGGRAVDVFRLAVDRDGAASLPVLPARERISLVGVSAPKLPGSPSRTA